MAKLKITKAIEKKLEKYPLGSQKDKEIKDVIVKFFQPKIGCFSAWLKVLKKNGNISGCRNLRVLCPQTLLREIGILLVKRLTIRLMR